jgi:Actinobacteria/chloroflexi VLRF1 release factor
MSAFMAQEGTVGTVSGPRWVEVEPARMARWLEGFAERHGGEPAVSVADGVVTLTAPDGSVAECHAPPGAPPPASPADLAIPVEQRIGLVLARRGGYAVGVADGAGLVASKVDSRYVQSRTAAGGWSQRRFARRRDNQAKAAAAEAADECVRLLLPEAGHLAALVTGGDRQLVDVILADARLTALRRLRVARFLAVPDPKRSILESAVTSARAVRIRVT